jgi:hypothetical protein
MRVLTLRLINADLLRGPVPSRSCEGEGQAALQHATAPGSVFTGRGARGSAKKRQRTGRTPRRFALFETARYVACRLGPGHDCGLAGFVIVPSGQKPSQPAGQRALQAGGVGDFGEAEPIA